MKKRIVLPVLFLLTTAVSGSCADLYFFKNAQDAAVTSMASAHKLVFGDNAVDALDATGKNKTTVPYADFDYILLKESQSGLNVVEAVASPITVRLSAGVEITAASDIREVIVYDVMGRTVGRYTPGTTQFSIPASSLPTGTLLVKASSADATVTVKTFLH